MNYGEEKSALFDLDGYLVAIVLWILSFFATTNSFSIFLLIATIIVLAVEDRSSMVRNHASQILALNIVSFILSLIINIVFGSLFITLGWIAILGGVLVIIIQLLSWAFRLIIIAYNIIGIIKAIQKKHVSLPVIGFLGDRLEQSKKKQ